MKLLSAAASILLLLNGAVSQECPETLTQSQQLTDDGSLSMYYAVVAAPSTDGQDILCVRLESDTESWIALGISPTGKMEGGEAIIGLPDEGTVRKYKLGTSPRIEAMPDQKQTLMSTNITQVDGKTVMSFTKHLYEDSEHEIIAPGTNKFLYAFGTSNEVKYHSYNNRGAFDLELDAAMEPTSSSSIAKTFEGSGSDETSASNPKFITQTPTEAAPGRDELGPPVELITDAPAPAPSAELTTDAPVPAPPTDTEDLAPTPPAESTPATLTDNGAMDRSNIGRMILTAGSVAVWFSM